MGSVHNAAEKAAQDHQILGDMLVQADRLCRSRDPLLKGQFRHLRDRIAALLALTAPLVSDETAPLASSETAP